LIEEKRLIYALADTRRKEREREREEERGREREGERVPLPESSGRETFWKIFARFF
jgi:hypothetical protein